MHMIMPCRADQQQTTPTESLGPMFRDCSCTQQQVMGISGAWAVLVDQQMDSAGLRCMPVVLAEHGGYALLRLQVDKRYSVVRQPQCKWGSAATSTCACAMALEELGSSEWISCNVYMIQHLGCRTLMSRSRNIR